MQEVLLNTLYGSALSSYLDEPGHLSITQKIEQLLTVFGDYNTFSNKISQLNNFNRKESEGLQTAF